MLFRLPLKNRTQGTLEKKQKWYLGIFRYFQHTVIMHISAFYALNFATSNLPSFDGFMLYILLLPLLQVWILLFSINNESKKKPILRFFLSKTYWNLQNIKLSIPNSFNRKIEKNFNRFKTNNNNNNNTTLPVSVSVADFNFCLMSHSFCW